MLNRYVQNTKSNALMGSIPTWFKLKSLEMFKKSKDLRVLKLAREKKGWFLRKK
jgi:hypothetical protein